MVIYMNHPVHGTKVATGELEAKDDEKNGWIRYEVSKTITKQDDPDAVVITGLREENRQKLSIKGK